MSMIDLLAKIGSGGGGVAVLLVVACSLIQLTPIKLNPWSWFGKIIFGSIFKRLDRIEHDMEVNKHDDVRYKILAFNAEIIRGQKHTQEQFDNILMCIDDYEIYCSEHPDYKNNKAKMAVEHITNTYAKCQRDNSFL